MENRKIINPTIAVLIPAYRTQYLPELFLGFANQTFKDFIIILSDDSPNLEVTSHLSSERMSQVLSGLRLQVVPGPRRGTNANINNLLDRWGNSTPLVHVIMDDDVIFPSFYEQHSFAHSILRCECSISGRWYSNSFGQPTGMLPVPMSVRQANIKYISIEQAFLFQSTVTSCNNWLGELSNCVMRREAVLRLRDMSMDNVPYSGLGDIGLFLDSAEKFPIAYIPELLGFFRIHGNQYTGTAASPVYFASHVAWVSLAIAGYRKNHLTLEDIKTCIDTIAPRIKQRFSGIEEFSDIVEFFSERPIVNDSEIEIFLAMWSVFCKKNLL